MDLDDIRVGHASGRQQMIAAFADLATAAMRAGVEEDTMHEIQERFLDGNVRTKQEFWLAIVLAEIAGPPGA